MSSNSLRVFSPVVIFHDAGILSKNIPQQSAKISEYKEKVMQMMERNAKLWSMENDTDINVSPSTSTTSTATTISSTSSSASTCDSIETIDTIQDIHHHYHHQPVMNSASVSPYPTLLYAAACHSNDKNVTKMSAPPLQPSSLSSSGSSPCLPTHAISSSLSSSSSSTKTSSSSSTPPPPPPSSAPAIAKKGVTSNNEQKKRRRGNLSKPVTLFLRDWLLQHKKHPYPSEKEKIDLAHQTGLTVNQISNWFINARRRILQPMLESEGIRAHLLSYSFASSSTAAADDHSAPHPATQSHFHHQHQQYSVAFSASPASSLSSPTSSSSSSSSATYASLSPSSSLSLMEQKKRRQLDIYAYQGFAESYPDDARRWAFRRTKLPSFDMNDYYSVAIR